MIGYQILAIEQENGSFLCDKVSAYFSIEINIMKKEAKTYEAIAKEAERIYNMFGKDYKDKEFPLTKDELIEISKATNCIAPNSKEYHKLACDGIIIIPKTKDNFLDIKEIK